MKAKIPVDRKQTVKVQIPEVADRHQVHILNPMSGGKRGQKAFEAAKNAIEKSGGEILISKKAGGIEELTAELFAKEPFAHAIVYGGDGSVYEAVNGIMKSGNSRSASFSVIPLGSGNDFSRYVNDSDVFKKAELNKIDVIRCTADDTVRFCVNVMNMGFDCAVVLETNKLKKYPFLQGSAAYLAGVLKTLLVKKAENVKITLLGCEPIPSDPSAKPEDMVLEQKVLLTACANARFYGGGFCVAPIASISDGMMDVFIANDMSVPKFFTCVGAYHEGTFIDEQGAMPDRYRRFFKYYRCRGIEINGPRRFCLDGEIFETAGPIRAEVIPDALWYAAL